jgi:hypothetical protein
MGNPKVNFCLEIAQAAEVIRAKCSKFSLPKNGWGLIINFLLSIEKIYANLRRKI